MDIGFQNYKFYQDIGEKINFDLFLNKIQYLIFWPPPLYIFPLCGITGYNVWYVVFTSINRLHISQMWKLSCPGILSDFLCHIIFMKVVYGPYYGKHSVSNYIIYINDERLHLYLSSPVFEPINEDLADICFSSNWCFKKVFRPFSRKIVIVSGHKLQVRPI